VETKQWTRVTRRSNLWCKDQRPRSLGTKM